MSVQLDSPSLPRWNDDGITVLQNSDKGPQFLIFSFGGNLSTLDIEGAPTVAIDIPAWHSSGRVAFTVKSKMEVRVWNVFDNNTVDEEQIISVPDTPRNEYAMPTGKLQDQAPSYLASTGTAASRTVYSPNGRFLATSGFLYTVVRIIDLSGTGNVQVVPTSPAAWQIAWSPDSHLVAFATSTFQAEIWFVPSDGGALQLQQALGPGRSAYGMAWNPSGTSLAMGLDDGSIQIWEDPLQGVADVHSLQHPISSGRMVLLAYSPDGQMLLSSSLEGTLVIWRLDMAGRGSNVHTMQSKSSPPLITRWMPPTQGRPYGRLTTSASDGSIRVWDPHASSVSGVSRLRGHSSWVYVVAYSPDGMYLASGSKDGTVRVWQAATGYALAAELQPLVFRGSGGWVVTLVWMRSTSYSDIRIASGHADGTVLLFECDGSCARGSQPAKRTVLEGHEGCIQALQRSPDGTYLASSAADGTTRLWQLPHLEGTGGHVLDGQDGAVTSLMFSPDSRHLATASTLSTVCIWRLQGTGATLLTTLRGHVGRVNAVVYSPDGELLLTASDDETLRTYLIDNSDGSASLKQVVTSHSGPVISVVISQDSSLIATGSRDGAVRLHRRASPDAAVVLVNQAGKQVKKLALSQDGLKVAAIVAASSRGGSVCVWDVTKALESLVVFPTGAQEAEFSSRQELLGYGNARLGALDFSLDGRNVAYGGSNFDVVVTTLLDVDEAFQGLEQVMVGNISLTIHNVLELDLPLEVLGQ